MARTATHSTTDARFTRQWDALNERARPPASLAAAIRHAPSRSLVAALAAVDEPVAANVIATELLNRLERARFLGAAVASAAALATFAVTEWAVTGTLVLEEATTRGHVLVGFLASVTVASAFCYALWLGRMPRLRRVLRRRRHGY